MKNSMKTICLSAFVLLSIVSCKKRNDAKPQTQTDQFAVAIQTESQRSEPQKAILIGSKSELEAAAKKKEGIRVIRVSDKNPVFRIILPTEATNPDKPVDPSTPCWKEIHAFYEAHYQEWVAQANENCKSVPVCLSCPKAGFGLNVLYIISPTSPKCLVMEEGEQYIQLTPFNFGNDDYDTQEVAEFIQKIKR